jgi:hypothetical protein
MKLIQITKPVSRAKEMPEVGEFKYLGVRMVVNEAEQ